MKNWRICPGNWIYLVLWVEGMCAPFKSNLLWVTSSVFSAGCMPVLRVSQVGIHSKQTLSYMYIRLGLDQYLWKGGGQQECVRATSSYEVGLMTAMADPVLSQELKQPKKVSLCWAEMTGISTSVISWMRATPESDPASGSSLKLRLSLKTVTSESIPNSWNNTSFFEGGYEWFISISTTKSDLPSHKLNPAESNPAPPRFTLYTEQF